MTNAELETAVKTNTRAIRDLTVMIQLLIDVIKDQANDGDEDDAPEMGASLRG